MKKNKLLNYFKNYTPLIAVSAALIILGIVIWRYAYSLSILATPIMAIGAVSLLIFFNKRVGDGELNTYKANEVKKLTCDRSYEYVPDFTFEAYDFNDCNYKKQDGNNSMHSEKFVHTDVFFEKNLLAVEICNINIETLESNKTGYEFAYGKTDIKFGESEFKYKEQTKKFSHLTLTCDSYSCFFPVKNNSIEPDELIKKYEHKVKKMAE